MYVCQCRSVNLSILRNINDQHDNVAIGETPFSTGYTWVTTLHKVIIVLTNNCHQPSYLVIHKTTASKLEGHISLHSIFVILVAFKWVACPCCPFYIDGVLAFVRSQKTFLDTGTAADKDRGGVLGFRLREKCRQLREKWSAGCNSWEFSASFAKNNQKYWLGMTSPTFFPIACKNTRI